MDTYKVFANGELVETTDDWRQAANEAYHQEDEGAVGEVRVTRNGRNWDYTRVNVD